MKTRNSGSWELAESLAITCFSLSESKVGNSSRSLISTTWLINLIRSFTRSARAASIRSISFLKASSSLKTPSDDVCPFAGLSAPFELLELSGSSGILNILSPAGPASICRGERLVYLIGWISVWLTIDIRVNQRLLRYLDAPTYSKSYWA